MTRADLQADFQHGQNGFREHLSVLNLNFSLKIYFLPLLIKLRRK